MASKRLFSAASRLPALRKLAIGDDLNLYRTMASAASKLRLFPDADERLSSSPLFRRRRRERDFSPLAMFQDLWDPLLSSRNLKQMMDTVDRVFDDSVRTGERDVDREGAPVRTPWDVISKADAYYLRVDMPGLGKEDVSISVEDGQLLIKGEPTKKEEDEWSERSYGNYLTRVTLPDDAVHDQIKAEMKNGVLKMTIPKLKEEVKSSTLNIQVD